jgi:hypothetical protein
MGTVTTLTPPGRREVVRPCLDDVQPVLVRGLDHLAIPRVLRDVRLDIVQHLHHEALQHLAAIVDDL